jgi:Ulp1 family protease
LSTLNTKSKTALYYDSCHHGHVGGYGSLVRLFIERYQTSIREPLDWEHRLVPYQQQSDGFNCSVFLLHNLDTVLGFNAEGSGDRPDNYESSMQDVSEKVSPIKHLRLVVTCMSFKNILLLKRIQHSWFRSQIH